MRIIPTYGEANKAITNMGIPRSSFYALLWIAIMSTALSNSLRSGFVVFAVGWVIVFVLTYKDKKFFVLFRRSMKRAGRTSSAWIADRGSRKSFGW